MRSAKVWVSIGGIREVTWSEVSGGKGNVLRGR